MSNDIRAFIAVQIDPPLKKALAEAVDHFQSADADVKWVRPENIHLTLKFLGSVPPKKVKAITDSLPLIAASVSAFEMDVTHASSFPAGGHPRIIWMGIEKNADLIQQLAESVENEMCRLGFGKGKKDFSPHLTVGRVRSGRNIKELMKRIDSWRAAGPLRQTIQRISLIKSTLTPQGPVYEVLNRVELKK